MALGRYALAALIVVVLGIGSLWMLLDEAGRRGCLMAGLVAYPVQVAAFWLLLRARREATRFLVWWGAGIGLRVSVVVAAGVASRSLRATDPAALVLSLVGFFFILLLIEPIFLKVGREEAGSLA